MQDEYNIQSGIDVKSALLGMFGSFIEQALEVD